MIKNAVIVDACRTPIGRSKGGAFRETKSDKLSVALVEALLQRNPCVVPDMIEELIWGCVKQTLSQDFNIARLILLQSNIPVESTAYTVNRLCGSSLEAINSASRMIMLGEIKAAICGGVEHMQHIPMMHGMEIDSTHFLHYSKGSLAMGLTAEYLAILHNISREEQDKFSYRSHMRAHKADFSKEIIPMMGLDKEGLPIKIDKDECIRPDTTLEGLAALKPVFYDEGTITAGNSSAIGDGAAACLLMEEEFAKSLGFKDYLRVKGFTTTGISPAIMGYGPVPATEKLLNNLGMKITDIDLVELNEAFAAQAISVLRDLGLLEALDEKVNLCGSSVALGHPLAMTGCRLAGTLFHQMRAKNLKFGLVTLCVGLGMGMSTLFERINN
jgi:acetyl-CoA acyltransferase